jgi:hypothetical protein
VAPPPTVHPRLKATLRIFSYTLVVVLLAGAIAYSVWTRRIHREVLGELAVVSKDVDGNTRRLEQLRARVQAADAELAELQSRAGQAQAFAAVLPPGLAMPAAPASRDPVAAGNAFLGRHPAVKTALVERSRARVAAQYAQLYPRLGLTPAQVDQFENLMMSGGGGWGIADADGLMMLQAGRAIERNELNRQLRALLGEQGYARFQAETPATQTRHFTTRLAAGLYTIDAPLSAAQYDQLTRFLAQRNRPNAAGTLEPDVRAAIGQLGFTAAQTGVLEGLLAEDAFSQRRQQSNPGGRK